MTARGVKTTIDLVENTSVVVCIGEERIAIRIRKKEGKQEKARKIRQVFAVAADSALAVSESQGLQRASVDGCCCSNLTSGSPKWYRQRRQWTGQGLSSSTSSSTLEVLGGLFCGIS